MRSVISIHDFCREDIDKLIIEAGLIKQGKRPSPKKNLKVASLFFENSTRTRVSSETAVFNMGGLINGFSGVEGTSVKKGEPLLDTVRMFECYGYEALVMRHNLAGAARLAAENIKIPVINGGDGSNGHPTQTLLDLFTIHEVQGKIDGLKVALVGDLKYGRTVHSLLQALGLYEVEIYMVSPQNLKMPEWRVEDYKRQTGKNIHLCERIEDILPIVDVLYMTRIQRERFPTGPEGEVEFNKISGKYRLEASMLRDEKNKCKANLAILHPLPRDKNNIEITVDVDKTPYAKYFEQAQNGLYMREAVLGRVFGDGFKGKEKESSLDIINKNESLWQDLPVTDGSKKGEKLVYRLNDGTLIDHLEAGKGALVARLLELDRWQESEVVLALNIRSQKWGRKDVLAIHGMKLSPKQLYKLALVSQAHTVNFIHNQRVEKKGKVILPSILKDLVVCRNHLCISRKEHKEFAPSLFHVEQQSPLQIRCHYCEELQTREDLEVNYDI